MQPNLIRYQVKGLGKEPLKQWNFTAAFWVWARFAGSIFILPNTARSWYSVGAASNVTTILLWFFFNLYLLIPDQTVSEPEPRSLRKWYILVQLTIVQYIPWREEGSLLFCWRQAGPEAEFMSVSGHNLEGSQSWDFRKQCQHYKPVSNHFGSKGGGE